MRSITVDLNAIASNYEILKKIAGTAKVMAVVKANAYGHGMVEVAKKLEEINVDYLGVADIEEALLLRATNISSPLLAWLHSSDSDFEKAILANVELGISSIEQLQAVASAAKVTGAVAKLHLKVDTGLGRNGATRQAWKEIVLAAVEFESEGLVELTGIFSHFSGTSQEEDRIQVEAFKGFVLEAQELGANFRLRHISASYGLLEYPDAGFDMVRAGIALYGLNPAEDSVAKTVGLVPAMRVTAKVALVKKVASEQGVSYGYLYKTSKPTQLVLVPFGYGEGLPRNSTGKHSVLLNGKKYPIQARIAMDQFVLDVGDDAVSVGDEVVIFGDGSRDEPTAEDLALAAETINYEIVTRIGGRAKRFYL